MQDTDTGATDTSERTRQSSELVRPVEGRLLGGVAKGIADSLGIGEWIIRVIFIVTAFMGGLGLALYAAGWAFIRSEDETESPAERFFSGASTSRSWLGIGLIVIAGMIVLARYTFLAGEVIWALAILVVGLLLYLGYIPGRRRRGEEDGSSESKEGVQQMTQTDTGAESQIDEEPVGDSPADGSISPPPPPTPTTPTPPVLPPKAPRERSILGRVTLGVTAIALGVLALLDNIGSVAIDARPYHYLALAVTIVGVGLIVGAFVGKARWLILLLVLMIPTLIFSPYLRSDARTEFDLRTRPVTFAELDTSYEIDFGQMVIDLTALPWDGEEVELDARVDAGSMVIRLPDDVGIVGRAGVDIGQVSEPGRTNAGLGDPRLVFNEHGSAGTVFLDAHVSLGDIDIRRDPGGS